METTNTSENTPHSSRSPIRKILVPLDGSAFAQEALPIALRLAKALGAEILAVRVTPYMTWSYAAAGGPNSGEMYERLLQEEEREVDRYLSSVATQGEESGVRTFTLAARGDPATILLDVIAEDEVDLVVMTTHGRTGAMRFALGSVADRVLRGGSAPTLLIRSFDDESGQRAQRTFEQAVLTVDGSSLAESAFDVLMELAGSVIKRLTLLRVLPLEAGAGQTQDARNYLYDAAQRLRERLAGKDCEVTTELAYGDTAASILEEATERQDLIIMATHGHTGARRWAYGSVTDRVLHQSRVPMLVTRPSRPPSA